MSVFLRDSRQQTNRPKCKREWRKEAECCNASIQANLKIAGVIGTIPVDQGIGSTSRTRDTYATNQHQIGVASSRRCGNNPHQFISTLFLLVPLFPPLPTIMLSQEAQATEQPVTATAGVGDDDDIA